MKGGKCSRIRIIEKFETVLRAIVISRQECFLGHLKDFLFLIMLSFLLL